MHPHRGARADDAGVRGGDVRPRGQAAGAHLRRDRAGAGVRAVSDDPERAAAVQGGLQEIRRAQQLCAGERAGHARGQELRARGL